jgi:hypothetical protein
MSTQEPMCSQRKSSSAFRFLRLADVQDFINGQGLANSDSIIVFRPLPTHGKVPVPLPSLAATDQVYSVVPHIRPIRPPNPFQDSVFCILCNSITVRIPPE